MMRQTSENENLIRQYLLGEVPEAEQTHFEERFFLNPAYREQVLIVENELIDDYLKGALTEQEQKRFKEHFLSSPQQLRKLRIAQSIKKYVAVTAGAAPQSLDEESSAHKNGQTRSFSWLNWRNPFVLMPAASLLVVLMILGVGKLIEVRQLSDQREQEQHRHSTDEQELAQMNDPAKPQNKAAFTVVLSSIVVRDAQVSGLLSQPAEGTVVEFHLLLVGEKYPSYQVQLQKIGELEPYAIKNLHAESKTAGQAVVLRVPAHLLTRGDYQIQLLGVTTSGETEPVRQYEFQVMGPQAQ
jgi:hypothetical protein